MTRTFSLPRSIVIIGGGFAGAVTAIKLLDSTAVPLAITLIDEAEEPGRGVAYGTTEAVHLVNGAAKGFGLYPDDPDHLVNWLKRHGAALGWTPPDDVHDSSPPRWIYGSYVNAELQRAVGDAAAHSSFCHVRDRAIALKVKNDRVVVATAGGGKLTADQAVLALGVFQGPLPASELAVADHPGFIGNPWNPAALDRLAGTSNVLIVGASLSMVDVVASLEARGFAGQYTIVSRRGLVVERRRTTEPWHDFLGAGGLPLTAKALLSRVKAERRRIADTGEDWQRLPLAIRPHILLLWKDAPDRERLRFARHLRAFWDVTAHRAAPEAYAKLDAARAVGRVNTAAGRVLALAPAGEQIAANIRWRADGQSQRALFDGVVNCRGHQLHDWRLIGDALVRDLLATGTVRPHSTGIGIDATRAGEIIGADGQASERLFAIGHPLRGVAWESSSIGEQLALAIALAGRLLGSKLPVAAPAEG